MPEGVGKSTLIPASLRRKLGINAEVSLATLQRSALCTATMRARGVRCGLVRCAGHLPRIYSDGSVILGRELGIDARMGRIEIGATVGGELVIGDRVVIGSGSSLVASLRIIVGDDVMIADGVGVFDNDFHAVDMSTPKRIAETTIESRVWLCRRTLIMPGVTVGADSVVAAGAVVTKDVPPRTLVAGVPARVVRELDIADGWRRSRVD